MRNINEKKRGKLLVLEGLDSSGKATQADLLMKKFEKAGKEIFPVSFPDYNEPSSVLVKMYLSAELGSSPEKVNAFAASSFYAVDRYVSFVKHWKEKFQDGCTILADRYTTSNAIFQLCKLPENQWDGYLAWLEDYEYERLNLPRPDLVIYLDIPVEVSQSLMLKRYKGDAAKRDLHEKNLEFLNFCRQAADFSAKKMGWHIIDCCPNGKLKTVDKINCEIFEILKNNYLI